MTSVVYNLSDLGSIYDVILDPQSYKKGISKDKKIRVLEFENNTWIIKYNRKELVEEDYSTIGKLRSVIVKDGKIMSYSPPKSISYEYFKKNIDMDSSVKIEEYVEGTMIHLYWDEKWKYGTKSSIYAKHTFYDNGENDKTSFSEMFLECLNAVRLNLDELPKYYSYCFVMQHPKNRIVAHISECGLYLISMYSIVNNNVIEVFNEKDSIFGSTKVRMPKRYNIGSYDEIEKVISGVVVLKDINMNYESVGLMIKSGVNRCKLRNAKYEYVKRLKGNQPKLMYQYLQLKKDQKIKEYLYYFPEVKDKFDKYDERMREFIQRLYQYYVNCFIFKEKELSEYPYEFRNHLYVLHSHYLNHALYNNAKNMGYEHVKRYIHGLEPAQLMFSLNFHLREKKLTKELDEMVL